jgi:hypothetical protein
MYTQTPTMNASHRKAATNATQPRRLGKLLPAPPATSGAKRFGNDTAAAAARQHSMLSVRNPPLAPESLITQAVSAAAITNCASVCTVR